MELEITNSNHSKYDDDKIIFKDHIISRSPNSTRANSNIEFVDYKSPKRLSSNQSPMSVKLNESKSELPVIFESRLRQKRLSILGGQFGNRSHLELKDNSSNHSKLKNQQTPNKVINMIIEKNNFRKI